MVHHYPNVTVKAIIRCDGMIFMLRHNHNGAYDFPGGQMEWGETPEQTLARELHEELGYAPAKTPQFFGIYNYVAHDKSRHSVQLLYLLPLAKRPQFHITEDAIPLWLEKDFFLEQWRDDHAKVERMFANKI